jgi:hypothetical protein
MMIYFGSNDKAIVGFIARPFLSWAKKSKIGVDEE